MAVIYLIRHGQASFGKAEYDQLSSVGEQQAKLLGEHLAKRIAPPNKVFAGTMQRHQATAKFALTPYDNDLFSKLDTQLGWNEYAHQEILGVFDDRLATPQSMRAYLKTFEQPMQQFLVLFNAAIDKWMSGAFDNLYSESWSEFKQRVHSALAHVVSTLDTGETAMVFTSGGPISLLSQALLGVPESQLMKMNETLVNCGVTKLITSSQGIRVATLNEHTAFEFAERKQLITYT